MRSTIDKAGRLVMPKPLRDQLGPRPGDVELTADWAALRVVPVHAELLARLGTLGIAGGAVCDALVGAAAVVVHELSLMTRGATARRLGRQWRESAVKGRRRGVR